MRIWVHEFPERARLRAFLSLRRAGESDRALGTRLALSATLLFFGLLVLLLVVCPVEAESGLGAILGYWLFIGAVQVLWLIPGIAVASLAHRPELRLGILRGAALVALFNGLAWVLGLWLGVR